MKTFLQLAFLLACCYIVSCSESGNKENANKENPKDESCVQTTKDPNEVKPMALMMRTMANYCDSMRLEIKAGKKVDSIRYPLMPFWTAEPTDSSVLETLFFDNAKIIESAWHALMTDTAHQAARYTAVVDACVHCHQSYCSGPLRRIKKLPLD
ncbi:MAG: hypothetical protein JNJ58_04575 [Chitinophagaceae bacterium]|nr:hypothetical protein [Chitinophagaceae bacterium]